MSADPFGRVLTDIRDFAAVAALTDRVRGGEPMGKQVSATGAVLDAGDERGPGHYVRFVVLTRLGDSRLKRAPMQEVRLLARCYGLTAQDAAALRGAVSDAIHARGHRTTGAGVVIFGTFDDGGEGAVRDPDTAQPYESLVISTSALTELLA